MSVIGNPLLMNGGGGVTPYIVNITCDSEFAGQVISMEQTGQTSVSAVCPSSAPYVVTLKPKYSGTWTIKGTVSGTVYTSSVSLSAWGTYTAGLNVAKVYGISRDTTNSSPEWTRTDDAVGFTFSASVGSTAGSSSFDSCLPWSGITREVVVNELLVKIPKFWFKRYVDGTTEHIQIADRAKSGFDLHPAFQHNGTTQDYIYVGAYKNNAAYLSNTGSHVKTNTSRATARSGCANKGVGYGQLDITTLSAIQMLILVETATNDVQSAIGRGYCDGNSSYIQTGTCDSVANLTGRPSGTDGKVDVVWRGIEGLWGNTWEFVDAINLKDGHYYICNNQNNYADNTTTNYTQLDYDYSAGWSTAYITEMGCDANNSAIILPKVAGSGSATTYYCDAAFTSTVISVWTAAYHGGAYNNGSLAGLLATAFDIGAGDGVAYIGSRSIYIPQ